MVLSCSYMLSCMHSWAVNRAAWSLSKAMKFKCLETKVFGNNYERPTAIAIWWYKLTQECSWQKQTKSRRLLGEKGFICKKRDRSFEFETQKNLGNNLLRKLIKHSLYQCKYERNNELIVLAWLYVSAECFHCNDTVGVTNKTSVHFNLKRVTPMLDH